MYRVVTVRRFTAETQVRPQATLCGICSGKGNIETWFSKITSVFHRLFHQCPIFIFTYTLLSTGRNLRTSQKVKLFRKSGSNG
jgi:hypothetical protein